MNKEPTSNRQYWAKRHRQEERWIKQNLANDEDFAKQIQRYYDQVIAEINKTIDMNANLITDASGKPTGYKPVSKEQMAAYEAEAQKVVAQADAMRANHKHPTYDDFPAEVNRRMRVYNATMRINRLELLKAQIGVDLLPAAMQTDQALQDKLSDDYIDECKRQAAIMEVTAQASMWTGKKVAKIVMAQTNSATFSQRLWANQDALKAKLDQVISTGIVQGQGPREMARRLKTQVKTSVDNQRYVTERIARTESARVQFTAQINSIRDHGYRFVHWYAEPRACVECSMIAHQDNGFGAGIYETRKVPEIPVHPNCRCSISETWVDGEQNLIGKQENDVEGVEDDAENIENVKDFTRLVHEKFGITSVSNMESVPPAFLQKIYVSLNNNFNRFPVLKGKLSSIEGYKKRGNSIAEYVDEDKSIKINLQQLDDYDNILHRSVDAGFWTQKSDYTGTINHEFGHFVQKNYPDLTGNYYEDSWSKSNAAKSWGNNLIYQALKNTPGEKLSRDNILKHCSKYGATNDYEMFAEYYSSEADDPVIKEFNKLLNNDPVLKRGKS